MKEISLTQGRVALVDDDDFEQLNSVKWQASKRRRNWYASRSIKQGKKVIREYMHIVITGLITGEGFETDHIDGDGLNNQKVNLRIVTRRQNCQNLHIEKSSKYPGVYRTKRNTWKACIDIGGVNRYLGTFKTEEKAFRAYRQACSEL